MADGLYISMAGAAARAAQLDSLADNLSNAQSPGFKAGTPAFQTFMTEAANDKGYPASVASGFDMRPGEIRRTGNPLDVVPEGTSFLAVQNGNQVGYTRNGRLSLDAQGRLSVGEHPVLGIDGQPISAPPGAVVEVQTDGRVTTSGQPIGQLALFQLEGSLQRVGPSLLAPAEGGRATPSQDKLRTGELEQSNASTLDAAVQLVSVQRHYENSMQALQTYRRMDERANEVGRVR